MRIAVDAMGGDFAPEAAVEGAVIARRDYGARVLLVGRQESIRKELARLGANDPEIEVLDAPGVIEMHEPPAQAVRRKKDASLVVCADLVRHGKADAMVSAGSTGAVGSISQLALGRIAGVKRPAVAIVLPSRTGHTILLDAGATVDVEPQYLVQFAAMGTIYARELFGVESPRVGLLNIGEEEGKGNRLMREAFPLLKESGLRFTGNIEGPDLFNGRVDVAVCDGFTGNVVLKVGEGVAEFFVYLIREEVQSHPLLALPAALLKPAFRRIQQRTDYGERGGALLLGVNGVCIIAHGRSHATAMANAIRTAGEAARHGIIDKIRHQFAA